MGYLLGPTLTPRLFMPNLAQVLKSEIVRLARREMRPEIQGLRKAVTTHRSEIAALKRRIQSLERELNEVRKTKSASVVAPAATPSTETGERFSAKALLAQRKRLGLSAHDVGLLVGTSSQSIYNWEQGAAKPRAQYLPALLALKTLRKQDAAELVAARKS
jgi:DNA-binding transcriptional regulator YiaG